jgi:hypothetical protein
MAQLFERVSSRPTRDDVRFINSFQPARASVRAIRSFPPNPASSIVLTTALTTSAKRRTGGFGATRRRGGGTVPVGAHRLHLPPCDRLDRHPKYRRRLALRQAEETPDPQDPESLLRSVVRALAFGDLVPTGPENPSSLAHHPKEQSLLLGPFEHLRSRSHPILAADRSPAEG